MAELVNIKQIQLSDGAHDIDAKYWNGHEWSELGNPLRFLGAAQSEVPTAGRYVTASIKTSPTGSSNLVYIPVTTEGEPTEISAEKGDVFVIASSGLEFLCTTAGTGAEAEWTSLGDETNFQQVGKTLQTSTPSTNESGLGGAINTTVNAGTLAVTGNATGKVEYKYSQAFAGTGMGGASEEANTGSAGAATINGSSFGFSGTAWDYNEDVTVTGIAFDDHAARTLTLGGTISVPKHSHTVTAPTSSVWGFASNENNLTTAHEGHTHDISIDTHDHGAAVDASKITDYTAPSMTAINFTPNTLQTLTTKNYGFNGAINNVMHSATVSTSGVLSWSVANAGAQDVLSEGTQASLAGGVFSAGTLTYSSVSAAGAVNAKTVDLTTGLGGSHDHKITCDKQATYVTSVTVNEKAAEDLALTQAYANLPSLTHAQAGTASVNLNWTYKPAGTITGSATIASHSHSYSKPIAHTHTIASTVTTATVDVTLSVAGQAAEHSHTVSVAAHTHDLGNHTHSVTTTNN